MEIKIKFITKSVPSLGYKKKASSIESDVLVESSDSVDRVMRGIFSKAGSGY